MSAPDQVSIDPAQTTTFVIEEESPNGVQYVFWLQRNGQWTGTRNELDDKTTSRDWPCGPPTPSGSVFAYWLGLWGKANNPWRVRITILQQDGSGASVQRASWTESGTLSNMDNGFGHDTTAIIKVTLV